MAEDRLSILFVDAYDSFTQNIIALLHQVHSVTITLIKIDTSIEQQYGLSLDQFLGQFDAVVLGPGPGDPHSDVDTGLFGPIILHASRKSLPVLGICLGFQVLCLYYNLPVERMPMPCHGHVKFITPVKESIAVNWLNEVLNNPNIDDIWATCYNSLGVRAQYPADISIISRPGSSSANSVFSVSSLSDESEIPRKSQEFSSHLRVLGCDSAGYAMIVSHDTLPLWGIQFHPESCKSNSSCRQMLQNWLELVQKIHTRVSTHRLSIRSPSCSNAARPQMKLLDVKQSRGETEIFDALMHATESTTMVVQWRKISTPYSRHDVSKLTSEWSGGSGVAMLESTKKGRFSIYSLQSLKEKQVYQIKSDTWIEPNHLCLSFSQSLVSMKTGTDDTHVSTPIPSNREDLMQALERFMVSKQVAQGPQEVPFWGGFIGYFSYEYGLEQIGLSVQENRKQINDIELLWVERSLVYDALTSTIYVQTIRQDDENFLNVIASRFQNLAPKLPQTRRPLTRSPESLWTKHVLPDRNQYNAQFEVCQSALHAGESYELCLTTEAQVTFTIPYTEKQHYVHQLYQNLQEHNPVPFAAYLDFPTMTILSSSPEQYMSWSRNGIIDMIPMKGTVKRTPDMTLHQAATILSSPKEQAENLMIADLIRHDLYSTVGATSNVEVIKLCEVVEHETVYQLVSHIRAHPPKEQHQTPDSEQPKSIHYGLAALQTTLPPGSMTGAPKKRSCEILQTLEKRDRGVYSGVLGYLDLGGGGCWSVCIRTAFRHKTSELSTVDADNDETKFQTDTWRIGAGGAITVLSGEQAEWDEMNTKLHSVLKGFRID